MDEILYSSLSSYFNALEYKGYMPYTQAQKLLILAFYRDFVFNDYRGLINKEDYHQIENALNCLYGSTCLIPYPDYLKMGKLHIGEISELANRVKTLEETKVLKAADISGGISPDSDVIIISDEE
jgi:hypothetical protein